MLAPVMESIPAEWRPVHAMSDVVMVSAHLADLEDLDAVAA
jgi:hypothetical protein